VLADLREFALQSDDHLEGPRDFASVSFAADGDRFYATLSTPDARYVLVGSLRERRLRTVKQGVAAEALSPDGRRLAVKQRIGDRSYWQLAVLDLATLAETPIDQGGRSVDDQVEWLDDERLVYHDAGDAGTGIWVTAADGRSAPRLLVLDAFSPAVVQRSR
jgi:hypothetical protein